MLGRFTVESNILYATFLKTFIFLLWFKCMIVNPLLNEIELIIYLLLIVIVGMTGKCPLADRACQPITAATWSETRP